MDTKELKSRVNYLTKELTNKNTNALAELYNILYKPIFRFLRRYSTNDDIIKDSISMTFVTVIEKTQTKIFFTNCYNWILTIAKYHLFNVIRKESKADNLEENFEIEDKRKTNIDTEITIKSFIQSFPHLEQRIIYLKFYEDVKINEIAKILSISVSTVKRKLKEIKILIKENFEYED